VTRPLAESSSVFDII